MIRYAVGRIGQGLLVLWAAFTVAFLILYLLPGDPVKILVFSLSNGEFQADPALVEKLRHEWGLDRPLVVQYLSILWGAIRLDFGDSYQTNTPAAERVLEVLPNTLLLGSTSLAIAIILGTVLALAINYTPFAWLRRVLASVPPLGVSVPGFWIGLLLIQLFAFELKLFPAMGDKGFESLVLPAFTMAIPTAAAIAQLLSRSLDLALREPYIEIATARGANKPRVYFRHALRNAVLPVLTMIAMMIGHLFAGAAVTETVFARTGIGRLTVEAVNHHDAPVVLALVLLAAAIFVLSSLVIDLIYPLVDPRITLAIGNKG